MYLIQVRISDKRVYSFWLFVINVLFLFYFEEMDFLIKQLYLPLISRVYIVVYSRSLGYKDIVSTDQVS